MTDESKKQDQLLETTDYLEAIGTIKSAKNFLFFLSIVSLLVLQSCFWFTSCGYVEIGPDQDICKTDSFVGQIFTLSVGANEPASTIIVDTQKAEQIEQAAAILTADPNSPARPVVGEPQVKAAIKIQFAHIEWLVQFCNFILIISVFVYSLTLLFALKISLIGRLGGISHITKAFYVSLFAIAFLLPWQTMFDGVISGAVYLPCELLAKCYNCSVQSMAERIVILGRFTGLWLVVVVLLIAAQLRSMKWARNILRRLGIA
ncbi:MAG: hypothetical protein K8R02_01600 [Anaerohalosphaeraceae bacterium]|nr:hypothetical protein [Anaerohalosphaeraceae bacterium]